MSNKTFYITTPIYYVNDVPHIGHAYTTVAADVLARYKRLKGYDVFFLTGTDEHGQKVEKSAQSANLKPIELADSVVVRFKELWKKLNISNNDFIRTSEERHKKAVEHFWKKVLANGDIYLGEYEDWYCTPCESFFTEKQLIDNRCPDCKRPVEKLKEPSYFFKMSKYQDELLKHIEANPDFIQPETKKNEIVNFIEQGLRDLSISRTTFSWGIPVPNDPKHVIYVWFDALINYLTACGYPDDMKYWPADIHLVGKDILRFHAVYWPTFLMAAGFPKEHLPKKVFAHGWWTVEGQKMSKSLGNVVDPNEIIEKYGVDAFRYFLLREVPFGLDGDFSINALVGRINGELANELGNLLSRTIALIVKNKKEGFPKRDDTKYISVPDTPTFPSEGLSAWSNAFLKKFDFFMGNLEFHHAIGHVVGAIKGWNKYAQETAPWAEKDPARLSNILYTLAEGLRIVAVYLYPFMPSTAEKIWQQLGIKKSFEGINFDEEVQWGKDISGTKVCKGEVLFPKHVPAGFKQGVEGL